MSRLSGAQRTISQLTRRDIFDYLRLENIAWNGRLDETGFLERIWGLGDMESTDSRFPDAAGDIWQHRINNPQDWDDDWIFTDRRFDLMHGADEAFLRFLSEMVHPVVRSDADEVKQLVQLFNEKLAPDGWVLVVTGHMSGRPVFEGTRKGGKHPTTALRLPEYQRLKDPRVFEDHLHRIEAGLAADPAAAIASSKEMVESVCKIILDDYDDVEYTSKDDLLDLYKNAAVALKLNAESVPDSVKGSQAAQGALRALVTTVQRLAELRNELGLGHGRNRPSQALTRHARLAFNTGSSVAEFLLDTWHERRGDG